MEKTGIHETLPRRGFLTRFFAGVAGAATALLISKKGSARQTDLSPPEPGPILYHRTEEAERYYRTLHR